MTVTCHKTCGTGHNLYCGRGESLVTVTCHKTCGTGHNLYCGRGECLMTATCLKTCSLSKEGHADSKIPLVKINPLIG